MIDILSKLSKSLTWQAVALFATGGVFFLLILFFAPPDVQKLLFGANGLVMTAIGYLMRSPNDGGPPPPPPPPLPVMMLLVFSTVASGCGATAMTNQWQALRATSVVLDAAADTAESTLTTEAARCQNTACLDELNTHWAPVEAASSGVLLAIQGWAQTLSVIEAAGNDDAPSVLWRAAARAVEALGLAWQRFASAMRAVGVDAPDLPPLVITLASAIGGAR